MNMTTQQIAVASAMKLTGDGQQNDPSALVVIIGALLVTGVGFKMMCLWRNRK